MLTIGNDVCDGVRQESDQESCSQYLKINKFLRIINLNLKKKNVLKIQRNSFFENSKRDFFTILFLNNFNIKIRL